MRGEGRVMGERTEEEGGWRGYLTLIVDGRDDEVIQPNKFAPKPPPVGLPGHGAHLQYSQCACVPVFHYVSSDRENPHDPDPSSEVGE